METAKIFQNGKKEIGGVTYLNKSCWLVKNLNYPPYKRCQYCEFKFRDCPFLQYQVISLVLTFFSFLLFLLVEKKLSISAIITVFTLIIVYGYFFNKSTEKIVKTNFSLKKTKKALEELTDNLNEKVKKQTKDITAKNKELEKKAKELEEGNEYLKKLLAMRSEFLDTASHQLRTPVSVIKGMMSMILEGGLPEAKVKEFMQSIFTKSVKLGEIINDILKASETESEKFNLDFKVADITPILEKIVEDKKILAEKKGLSFKLAITGKISPVMIDERYMSEAIGNLIDNSIKYTVKGGVFIKVEEKDRMILIRVSDTGIGIPKEDEPKLFDKFVRAKNAVNAYTDGTGLGLFIVKKIIKMHKGADIAIEWTEENRGTVFLITLPAVFDGRVETRAAGPAYPQVEAKK